MSRFSLFSFCYWRFFSFFFFFFNDTATTEIYTLSLHDALPISFLPAEGILGIGRLPGAAQHDDDLLGTLQRRARSEEHTSELQSQSNLVCRLLLEKKKKKTNSKQPTHLNTSNHKNDNKMHVQVE